MSCSRQGNRVYSVYIDYGANGKIPPRSRIFAHPSLAFDLVTLCDLVHQEWSISDFHRDTVIS